jgi:hypothetical protein
MTTIRHIFVHVVDRPEDPFRGLRRLLSLQLRAHHTFSEVRLSEKSYELIRKVEYSMAKYVRFLFYRHVFLHLEKALREALSECRQGQLCVLYFSDEGVWAEFLRVFHGQHPNIAILAVNVQHGIEYHVRPKYRKVRRAINWLSRRFCGYPAFGMGSFGGGGSGVFDIYLTYDKATRDFVREHTHDIAYACPSVIKEHLLERYRLVNGSTAKKSEASQEVMFALQPAAGRILSPARINGNLLGVLRELTPLAKLLVEKHGKRMVLRPHPSMDRQKVAELCEQTAILHYADIDGILELGDRLARCGVVMSYDSTVLWDAYILGLVPISLQGNRHRSDLPFPHEILDVTVDLEAQLEKVLCLEIVEKYRREIVNENFDWENIVMSFGAKTTTRNPSNDNLYKPIYSLNRTIHQDVAKCTELLIP